MAQRNFQFIGIDLDGTLLTRNKKIHKAAYAALDAFYDLNPNCIGAIITGRFYNSAKRHCDSINENTKKFKINYLGCGNGSLFYKINNHDDYQLIKKTLIKSADAKKIYDLCQKHKILFWGCSDHLFKGAPVILSHHFIGYCIRLFRYKDVNISKIYVDENYSKINVIASPKKLNAFFTELNELYPDTFQVIRTATLMFEITAKNTHKGEIVNAVCERHQIPFNKRVAIGDSNNDLKMFENVNIKVALANASPELKRAATYVSKKRGLKRFSSVFEDYLLKL